MNTKPLFQPKNRKDLPERLNQITALQNAIVFKIEFEKQIGIKKKLLSVEKRPKVWSLLLMVIAYNYWMILNLKRKLRISELVQDIEVKTKTMNHYHNKELFLENELEEIYSDMGERYDNYVDRLFHQMEYAKSVGEDLPEWYPNKDVLVLSEKLIKNPPKTKTDKLSFFLTVENLLVRARG
jgi:hypothetical protein